MVFDGDSRIAQAQQNQEEQPLLSFEDAMPTSGFLVKTHVFEAQHIRNYPNATRNGDSDVQYVQAKQYTPRSNPNPRDGDVTIIGGPGTSFPKELYEPLWEDLLIASERHGFRIRSIWIADASNHGASGILNERTQGDEPSFMDYARDLLHMTNVFREHMVQPIVGAGHSMGATTLIQLSLFHPRLFSSLAMFDPIIGEDTLAMGAAIIPMAAKRPDLWPSRDIATQIFRKAFRTWDSRTVDRWLEFGLRDTPTLLHPEAGKVTLAMSRAQESWSYGRPFFDELAEDGSLTAENRIKYPDADGRYRPLYRAGTLELYERLQNLQPDVLFVFPGKTTSPPESLDQKVNITGTGRGGSGGIKAGRVEKATIDGCGHLCTFEAPTKCAKVLAAWLGKDLKAWQGRVEYERTHRDDKSVDMLKLSDEWVRQVHIFRDAVTKKAKM